MDEKFTVKVEKRTKKFDGKTYRAMAISVTKQSARKRAGEFEKLGYLTKFVKGKVLFPRYEVLVGSGIQKQEYSYTAETLWIVYIRRP